MALKKLPEVKIKRITESPVSPTIGVLVFEGFLRMLTLEPPVEGPIVCIPKGSYHCVRVHNRTTLGGMEIEVTFLVREVPGREGILFHIGNFLKDTKGCILLGMALLDEKGIASSVVAFSNFLKMLEGKNDFILLIE